MFFQWGSTPMFVGNRISIVITIRFHTKITKNSIILCYAFFGDECLLIFSLRGQYSRWFLVSFINLDVLFFFPR